MHRDIAARNVLLSATNVSTVSIPYSILKRYIQVVKISDFGMSDDKAILHDDTLEKVKIRLKDIVTVVYVQVPMKWLAPETMQDKIYSLKSDVWSYGIMVYCSLRVW